MDQKEFWNGEAGARWVSGQEALDRVLGPLGQEALTASRAEKGERVLDVGCGCGGTSLALAEKVGTEGAVIGVDLSAPMLALAKTRGAGHANVTFLETDAGTYRAERPFDLLFSRFGVMFFEDPVAAFQNLSRNLRPGGRLAFVCWRAMAENPWMTVPLMAALTIVPPPEPAPPDAPGPFAFADDARVKNILGDAGFRDVRVTRRDVPVHTGPLEHATDYAMLTGPAGRLSMQMEEPTRVKIRDAMREALRAHVTENGVVLPAAQWVVTAARGT